MTNQYRFVTHNTETQGNAAMKINTAHASEGDSIIKWIKNERPFKKGFITMTTAHTKLALKEALEQNTGRG